MFWVKNILKHLKSKSNMKFSNNDKLKLLNIVFSLTSWLITILVLKWIGLLNNSNPNILLIANLAAFFFSLTTSPVTWIIKGLGLEIGSNTPNHFQVDKTIRNGEKTIIVRDYSHSHKKEEINNILTEQSKK